MRKKRNGGVLSSLFAIAAVILVLYFIPPMFVGHAVGGLDPSKIPEINGKWSTTTSIHFNQVECKNNVYDPDLIFNQEWDISQSGEKFTATSPSFEMEPGQSTIINYQISGGFSGYRILYGEVNASGIDHDGSHFTFNMQLSRFSLSDDCDSGSDYFTWKAIDERNKLCDGYGNATFTRMNPTGCVYNTCTSNFTCSDYSECVNGTQARTCFDLNQCNKTSPSKTEYQTCALPAPPSNAWIFVGIIFLILLIAGAIVYFVMRNRKKPEGIPSGTNFDADFRGMLDGMLNDLESFIYSGEKERASEVYSRFSSMFSAQYSSIEENDRSRIYHRALSLFSRLSALP